MSVLGVQSVNLATGTGSISTSVSVPSGTTKVIMFSAAFSDSGISMTASTLNGAAADASHNLNGNNDGYGTWTREWRTPTSGSQTLAITFSAASVYEGVAYLVYLNEVVSTGWRDAKSSEGGSISLTTVAGDLAIVLDTRYGSPAPSNQSGYTSLGTASSGTTNVRLRSIVATTTSTGAAPQDASFSIIAGVAIEQVSSSSPTLTDVDSDETVYEGQTSVAVTGTNLGTTNANRTFTLEQGSVSVTQTETGTGTSTSATLTIGIEKSGTDIKFGSANLKVTVGSETATIAVTVNPPSGYSYVNIGTPATDPDERVSTDGGDLGSGDQVWYEAVTGLSIGTDGRISWADGSTPAPFFCRVWDASDSTWGTGGTISPDAGATVRIGRLALTGMGR